MELTPLEGAVIETLLSRDEPGYDDLRRQLASCHAASREMTGVGFYNALEVDPSAPSAPDSVGNPVGNGRGFPDDVYADIEGLQHGPGFVLWLVDGRLGMLEGFTYEEPWPGEVEGFRRARGTDESAGTLWGNP
jgi:hypothetical protein